jgi:hypothetical protein
MFDFFLISSQQYCVFLVKSDRLLHKALGRYRDALVRLGLCGILLGLPLGDGVLHAQEEEEGPEECQVLQLRGHRVFSY